MRRHLLAFLFALVIGGVPATFAERITKSFDDDWQFAQGIFEEPEASQFDDSQWQRVRVPHDWAIAGPFDKDAPARGEGGFLPTGVGWYRKHFDLPAEFEGQRILIEFDGVMANSDVWVNGSHVGHRPNGYVSFCYDVTDHVRFGDDENVLAVRTDTSEQVASRWYTGTGIYRHVRLIVVDPSHIEPWGVFITTQRVSDRSAEVTVEVSINNSAAEHRQFEVHTTVTDAAGNEIEGPSTDIEIAGETVVSQTVELKIADPRLWNIDSPHLYALETEIVVNGEVVDAVTTPFGIRTSEFRSDTGYWLNGRNLKIKGVCLHHDGGAVGAAVPLALWEYRLAKLRELGVNAIRTAHNPVAPDFLDLCDRMGFLVMDEFFDCWTVAKRRHDYHKHFAEWAHRDMRDTIKRDRNHPCVILYSVGNEIHDTPKEELAKRILRGLVDVCHETDPTRPVTQALFRPNVSHDYDNGLADMLDVIGTNYRDFELLEAWHDKPGRKIVGTEQTHERKIWLACRDNPQHSGQFLWVGIDYLGESRRWPVTTFNSGLLDRTGYAHPRGRERQSWWSEEPMVAVFRRVAPTEDAPTDPGYESIEWQRRQVLFGDWTPYDLEPHDESVEVYSNCGEVELSLNGVSLGSKPLNEDAAPRVWRVGFESGELLAVGRNDGTEVARQVLRTAEPAHRIALRLSKHEVFHDWDDVVIVEAAIVDAHGNVVPHAADQISFTSGEAGEIVAVDNGSIVSHEPFLSDERRAFQGRCIAVVRAKAGRGTINVTAKADGLTADTAEIEIVDSQ